MNAIFFACKRVFHGAVRIGREPLQSVAPGLTAARFDMMFVLAGQPLEADQFRRDGMLQSELRQILGVSAPVVTRMLRSLEALGWVARYRNEYGDQRQRTVVLTEAGLACIRSAYKLVVRIAKRIVDRAICWGNHRDADARFFHMDTLECYLRRLRAYCRDTARLCYRWGHPDE
jgi:DNA-binding MarR family transcriptional regulator